MRRHYFFGGWERKRLRHAEMGYSCRLTLRSGEDEAPLPECDLSHTLALPDDVTGP